MRKSFATIAASAILVLSSVTGASAAVVGDYKSCGTVQTIVLHGEQRNARDWMVGKVNNSIVFNRQGKKHSINSNAHSGEWLLQSPSLNISTSRAYCSISVNSHDS